MLRPALSQILKDETNYYGFVVEVAARARMIAIESELNKVSLEEKTVKLAVLEFADGTTKLKSEMQAQHEEPTL